MADYQKMYYELMGATERAIAILIEAQQKCEDIYIDTTRAPLEFPMVQDDKKTPHGV